MATTWIVAADSARARVLQVADREKHLIEIEDFINPEGRLNERELTGAPVGVLRWFPSVSKTGTWAPSQVAWRPPLAKEKLPLTR